MVLNILFKVEAPTRLLRCVELSRVKWRGKVKATPRTKRLYGYLGWGSNENVDELHLDSKYLNFDLLMVAQA